MDWRTLGQILKSSYVNSIELSRQTWRQCLRQRPSETRPHWKIPDKTPKNQQMSILEVALQTAVVGPDSVSPTV